MSAITMGQLDANLRAAQEPLTVEERRLLSELDKNFFAPLPISQWENLEVTEYWKMMYEKGWTQPEH